MSVGAVLLAAGSSARLGQPKQLLVHEGRSLVRRAAEAALGAECAPVVVVLGAQAEAVAAELTGLAVLTVYNPQWEAGLGSSLRVGIAGLVKAEPSVEAAVVLLCDQLRVESSHLRALVKAFMRTHSPIVASGYEGTRGVPALFCRALFPELEAVSPEQGARGVIAREPTRVLEVGLERGGEDIDTAADLTRLH